MATLAFHERLPDAAPSCGASAPWRDGVGGEPVPPADWNRDHQDHHAADERATLSPTRHDAEPSRRLPAVEWRDCANGARGVPCDGSPVADAYGDFDTRIATAATPPPAAAAAQRGEPPAAVHRGARGCAPEAERAELGLIIPTRSSGGVEALEPRERHHRPFSSDAAIDAMDEVVEPAHPCDAPSDESDSPVLAGVWHEAGRGMAPMSSGGGDGDGDQPTVPAPATLPGAQQQHAEPPPPRRVVRLKIRTPASTPAALPLGVYVEAGAMAAEFISLPFHTGEQGSPADARPESLRWGSVRARTAREGRRAFRSATVRNEAACRIEPRQAAPRDTTRLERLPVSPERAAPAMPQSMSVS